MEALLKLLEVHVTTTDESWHSPWRRFLNNIVSRLASGVASSNGWVKLVIHPRSWDSLQKKETLLNQLNFELIDDKL